MSKYYIKCNGKTYGPASVQKITERIQSGFFTLYSYVSLDQKEWVIISDVEDFANLVDNPTPQPVLFAPSQNAPQPEGNENNDSPLSSSSLRIIDDKHSESLHGEKIHHKKSKLIWGSAIAFFTLVVLIISILLLVDKTNSFAKVSEKYGSSVGLVIVSIKNAQGVVVAENPAGTAFAIGKNVFATNAHVAEQFNKSEIITSYAAFLVDSLISNGALSENNAANKYLELCQNLSESIDNKELSISFLIRLNHCDGKTLNVKSVCMHPKYGENIAGEYDIATLLTTEEVETFFPTAKQSKLYSLKPGDEIAYMGFPMEGLYASGGIDFQKPEASLKSGTINKLTNVHDVFSPSPQDNIRITHDIPTVGGSSGSPIFTKNGEVVAILWGGNMDLNEKGERMPSAALHNFATRIDILKDVINQTPIEIGDFIK